MRSGCAGLTGLSGHRDPVQWADRQPSIEIVTRPGKNVASMEDQLLDWAREPRCHMKHMRIARVLLVGQLLLTSLVRGVEVAADYWAGVAGNPAVAPSPTVQGWTAVNPSTDVANFQSAGISPDGASGLNAWRMLDNSSAASQFLYWIRPLTAGQLSDAMANGWRLLGHMRLADPVAGNAGAQSVYLYFANNAGKRWIIFFDVNASGQIVASLQGGPTVTLNGVDALQYHTHEMVYAPAMQSADYLVDGVVVASGWAGTSGIANGVRWGSESSGGRGDGYFHRVSFVISDPPPPPAPVATLQPVSRAVPAGTAVTLTAGFSGSPGEFQWYRNGEILDGAKSASLVIPSAGLADAGDYWCRAANLSGSGGTSTAALVVLTEGAGLRITEFVAENDSGLRDEDGEQSDWIELANVSTQPVSTEGWSLSDDLAQPRKWMLPAVVVPPGGFVHVWASGRNRIDPARPWHANFALGNGAGEVLQLVRPDGSVASDFRYPGQYADSSYGETARGEAKYFTVPTPGVWNVDGQTSVKDGLALDVPAVFSGEVMVAAPVQIAGATARYTLDGSLPEFDSAAFVGPLEVKASVSLRVAYIYPGERHGATASRGMLRMAADVQSFRSPLPLVILSNHGAGAVPGVSARGPNGDGSAVTAVPMQAHSLAVLAAAEGETVMSSPVLNRSRAGLKVRGSSSFTFAEKSYSLETWGERDGRERDVALAGLPADADWVLYGPDPAQFDNTLIHNTITFELARRSGFPAPRYRFVELFLDSGGDLSMADHRGLAILLEKPSRGKDRVDFRHLSADGSAGGWMINVDRMDAMTAEVPVPRHFHTAGPDRILQTPDDNARGFQAIQSPGGTGSGSGITPANDDMPNFYHSFFNFESPRAAVLTAGQRGVIQGEMRRFDAALYGPDYRDVARGYAPLIDMGNWAHHLALHCYTKNQDAIVLSSYLYREAAGSPLRWASVWDFDRSFDRNTSGGSAASAALTWGHDRLFYRRMVTDPEFMQAYVDKWQELRRGSWNTAALGAMVDEQAAVITTVVAARSGLTAATWNANLATMKSWMTARAAAMDGQFVAGPVLSHPGGNVEAGYRLEMTSAAGVIHYTVDGSDPRQRGGAVAAAASVYAGPLEIVRPLTVTARVLNGAQWSGLVRAIYFPPQDLSALRLSEIHYHPEDQTDPLVDGGQFEFVELSNTGLVPLDLTGLSFTDGIAYQFPAGTVMAPGEFLVLVSDPVSFARRFPGCVSRGVFSGRLANAGETLTLSGGGGVLWSVTWDDELPWRPEADGQGMSLQRPDPSAPGNDPVTWTAAQPSPCAGLALTDSDADGLADYWEPLHGFVVGVSDGAGDADGDGASNAAEYLAGTDPRDAGSVFRIWVEAAPGGGDELVFAAVAGRSYRIEQSSDLRAWNEVRRIPAAAGNRIERMPMPAAGSATFFRAVTP